MAAVAQYHNVDLRTSRDDDEAYVLPTTTSRDGIRTAGSPSQYRRFDFTKEATTDAPVDDERSDRRQEGPSQWIHRDRLAEIEKEEMLAAGVLPYTPTAKVDHEEPHLEKSKSIRGNSSRIPVSRTTEQTAEEYITPAHRRHENCSTASRQMRGVSDNNIRSSRSTRTHKSSPSAASTSPSIRPRSRLGLEPRPSTGVNRPEGEAPWLATMYKPDPMLPQDQQIIPTHAKRQQQLQWEQAQRDSEQRRANLSDAKIQETPIAEDNWPLPSSSDKEREPNTDGKPVASAGSTEGPSRTSGGYSAMPRISPSQRGSSGQPRSMSDRQASTTPVELPRLTKKHSSRKSRDQCLHRCSIM